MNTKSRIVDGLIAICSLTFLISALFIENTSTKITFCLFSGIIFLIFFSMMFSKLKLKSNQNFYDVSSNAVGFMTVTELALINDEDMQIGFWEMYGKTSLVIGLDIGENKVDVDLLNSTYASTIDVEHAVLNYTGSNWYIEDLGSENGVSIVKSDGKKYKLTAMKPCLVEKGDMIYISITKLKLC